MPRGVYPHTHIKPKRYSADMVASVWDLYHGQGMSQVEVAAELGVTLKVIYRLMVNHEIPRRRQIKRNQTGPANSTWRGATAGYAALHKRVEVERGRPQRCSACERQDPHARYEWANLTGDYANVRDYVRLCTSCHQRYDSYRRAVTGERTSPVGRSA